MAPPPPYTLSFAVTYNASADAFVFALASYYPPVAVPRVGFSYVENAAIPDGVTFLSTASTENGITVAWNFCSSPVGTSALDLYTKILALYTGGGGGTVTSVTAGTGITVTGTATDPVVNNAGVLGVTAGTNITLGGTAANPIINAAGGGGGTVTSVTAGTGLTDTGTATDPVLNIANTGSGAGSTTLSALTRNAQGQITSAANGTGAQINAALGYTAANAAAVVNSITAGGHAVVSGTATNPIVDVKTPLYAFLYAGAGVFTTGSGAPATIFSTNEFGNIVFTSSSSGWQYTGTPTLNVEFEVSGIAQFQTGFSGPSSLAIGTCINGNPGGSGFETQTFTSVPNAATINTTYSFFVRRVKFGLVTNDVINIYATTTDSYWSLKEFVIRVKEISW